MDGVFQIELMSRLRAAFFIAMPKSKNTRNKKYCPGRPKIPAWTYDAMGPLTPENIQLLIDTVNTELNLIRMGSWDKNCYWNTQFALKQFWAFSKHFDQQIKNEMLATMASAAVQAIFDLVNQEQKGAKRCQPVLDAVFAPLDHAIQTYFAMMKASHRSEHEEARRIAAKMDLEKALRQVAVGGIAIIHPERIEQIKKYAETHGVAHTNGECHVGRLRVVNNKAGWFDSERESTLSITAPTLAFFVQKTKVD